MKRFLTLLFILTLIVLLLCSCIFKPHPPCVTQSLENVVSIELLDTDNYEETLLYSLSNEEFNDFWTQFTILDFHRLVNDPPTDYGILSVRITYKDGSIDIIGTRSNSSYSPDGKELHTGWYALTNYSDYITLFSHYVDESLLPQLN